MICVWGYTSDGNIDKQQKKQSRVARKINGNHDYINSKSIDLLRDIKVMNVKPQQDYFVALLVIKSNHGSAPD